MEVIIHNIIAPYRTPLFDEIARRRDATVLYVTKSDKNRLWDQDDANLRHPHHFLLTCKLGRLNWSPFLLITLAKLRPCRVICLDDDPNIVNFIQTFIFCRFTGVPLVAWCGRYKSRGHFLDPVLTAMRRFIYKRIQKVWSYSAGSTNFLIHDEGVIPEKIIEGLQGYPINLIDFEHVESVSTRYRGKSLVYIGEISDRKAVRDLLLPSFELLIEDSQYLNFRLDLIGDGPLLKELQAEYSSISRIKFHGYLEGKEKFSILGAGYFLILPSYADPWGWVVNEASSLGVPCAVSTEVMSKEMVAPQFCFTPDLRHTYLTMRRLAEMSQTEYQEQSEFAKMMAKEHSLCKALSSYELL